MKSAKSLPLSAALFLCALPSLADSYDTDFALRLPAAMSRFAGYADVAAVANSSAGSKWSTSVNPASTGFLPSTAPWKLSLTPQFSAITFSEGTNLYVFSEAVCWQSPDYGSFLPAAAQVRSNEASTALGPDFSFDSDIFQLQWGYNVNSDFAIGLNLSYTQSTVEFSQSGYTLANTDSEGIALRAGVLHQISPRLRAGLVAEYGATHNESEMLTQYLTTVSDTSTTEQVSIRPGISYEYAPDSTLFFDYQMLLISDTDAGHADFHRFSAGVDHQLFKGVFVRAGSLVDATGHFSWSCGAAVSPAKWVSIDFAYQHDFFPEIGEEFGHSDTFTLSFSFSL